LEKLTLPNNRLTKLPKCFTGLTQLQHLGLLGNPIEDGALLTLGLQRSDVIAQYVKELSEECQEIHHQKIMVIGDSMSGKTSLLRYLQYYKGGIHPTLPSQEERTLGIDVDIRLYCLTFI
jgi:hypothetical protein